MCLSNLKETYKFEDTQKKPYLFLKEQIIHAFKWYHFKLNDN
jgi:hypothetical protein